MHTHFFSRERTQREQIFFAFFAFFCGHILFGVHTRFFNFEHHTSALGHISASPQCAHLGRRAMHTARPCKIKSMPK